MLFERDPRFRGLPEDGFELFSIPDREQRRAAIVETVHPALEDLAQDLLERLPPQDPPLELHAHLPRLDWPRDYQPFCTWLALSTEAHGYQSGAQLNVGVHADHVGVRLGWDTSADAFGRFEFLCRHGDVGGRLVELATGHDLWFRVYCAEPWPHGSRCVLKTRDDLRATFAEVQRRGVWWELGRRYGLTHDRSVICSPELGDEVLRTFGALLPIYERITGA